MQTVKKQKQLTIETENKVGMLAAVSSLVAAQGINIEHICAHALGDRAVFCIVASDSEKAKKALQGKGYQIEETEVLLLRLWNRPGSLAAVATKLKQNGVDLQYVYGTSSLGGERMTVIFSSDDNDKAAEVFATQVIEESEETF